jgi:localization factor PodJL
VGVKAAFGRERRHIMRPCEDLYTMTDHVAWGVKANGPFARGETRGSDPKAGPFDHWFSGTSGESPRNGPAIAFGPAEDSSDDLFTQVADRLVKLPQETSAQTPPTHPAKLDTARNGEPTVPVEHAGDSQPDDIFTRVANRLTKRAAASAQAANAPRAGSNSSPHGEPVQPEAINHLLEAVTLRLNAIETKLDSGRPTDTKPLTSAIEKIEERLDSLSTALARSPGSSTADDMLRKFETRLAEIMFRLNQDTSSPAATGDDRAEAGTPTEAPLHAPLRRRSETAASETAPRSPVEAEGAAATERDRFAAALAEIRARQVRLRQEAERESGVRAFGKSQSAPAEADTIRRETPATPSSEDLTDRLDALARQIEETLASGNFLPMAEIIKRLEQIDARIEHPQQKLQLNRVKDLLRAVATRLEADDRNRLSAESLDALEDQLEHLARRVDEALRMRPDDDKLDKRLGEFERTIVELVDEVQQFQKSAALSVEEAARAGVVEALAGVWEALPPEIGSLKADIAEARSVYDRTEQRSHEMLTSVHSALERVLERLTAIEEDILVTRASEPSRRSFAASAAVTGEPDGLTARDRIFGPRLGNDDRDAPIEASPRRPDRIDSKPPLSSADVKASFIAAARRAAQGPTQDAAASRPEKPTETAASVIRGRGSSLIERLKQAPSRRRQLLLGLAALVLAVGAAQFILHMPRLPKPSALLAETARPAMDSDSAVGTKLAGKAAESASANPFSADPNDPLVTGSIKPQSSAVPPLKTTTDELPDPPPAIVTAVPAQLLASVPMAVGTEGLRTAAGRGDAAAIYELAARLAEGRGMTRNPQLAAQLFEAQANAGFVPAEYRIANHYEKGFGVDRDLAKAQSWYLKAAEKGNAKAMHNLAVLYAEGVNGKPDYATAAQWFRQAAEYGVHDSQFNLAILAARGLGMQTDLVEAYTWFSILANSGDQDAVAKRDTLAARLSPTDLATARAAAEQWKPKTPDPAANTVSTSPAWGNAGAPNATTGDATPVGASKSRA